MGFIKEPEQLEDFSNCKGIVVFEGEIPTAADHTQLCRTLSSSPRMFWAEIWEGLGKAGLGR